MHIHLNGEPRPLPQPTPVAALIDELGLGERRIAVEINLEIVPRGAWPERLVEDGDRVEIVHAVGGG